MMKVGLYGGAFDPVHNGHTDLAKAVVKEFALDKLIFIPSKNPPHKEPHKASAEDRLNMLNLVVRDMGRIFSVSDTELTSVGISYTFNTLYNWRCSNPSDDIYFICGSDIFSSIESWYRWRELFDMAKFIVVKRYGVGFDKMFSFIKNNLNNLINSGRLYLYDYDVIDVSSSFLRNKGIFDS